LIFIYADQASTKEPPMPNINPIPPELAGAKPEPLSTVRLRSHLVFLLLVAASLWFVAELRSRYGIGTSELTALVVLLSALASSIAGFAFSALCGAILFHTADSPVHVVEVMAFASVAIQTFMVAALWRDIDLPKLAGFLMGGLLGLPIGWYLLLHIDLKIYKEVMGVFLVGYGAYMIFRKPVTVHVSERAEVVLNGCVGVLGGITGGLAAFPGAFVVIWCQLRGWKNTDQRAMYQPFILIMQIVSLTYLASRGGLTHGNWSTHLAAMAYMPAALCGASAGINLYRRLSPRQFALAIYVAIVVSGAVMLI
jgi:uncharacterized protein